jgi:hypothetical protein
VSGNFNILLAESAMADAVAPGRKDHAQHRFQVVAHPLANGENVGGDPGRAASPRPR